MSADTKNGKSPRDRLLAVLLGVVVTGGALEFGYRGLSALGLLSESWSPSSHRLASFRSHIEGGVRGMFAPKAFVGYALQGEGSNAEGFSDQEWPVARTPGVPRIACLGGSTTQDGRKPERNNTYASYLSRMMSRRLGTDVEVLNFGVNGWTSAESLVNYALVVSRYQPDVVVIHHSVNDVWPRLYPSYRSDYTHYRVPWEDAQVSSFDKRLISWSRLWAAVRIQDQDLVGVRERVIRRVDGQPVELLRELSDETVVGYRGNMQRLCRLVSADGGTPVLMTMPYSSDAGGLGGVWLELLGVGTEEHNEVTREVAQAEGALLADAAAVFNSEPAEHDKFFLDYVHLRPGGNRVKALLVADALQRAKVFK
jgi:lysophospholipase L1-like esterase